MNWTIILGYVILILIQYFAVQVIFITIISSLIGKLLKNILLSMLLGSIVIWFIINLIWLKTYNHNLPLLAFILSLSFQFIHGNVSDDKLNEASKKMIFAEMWSIVLISIYVLAFKEFSWF